MKNRLEKQATEFIRHICQTSPSHMTIKKEKGNPAYLYHCSALVNQSEDIKFSINDIGNRLIFIAKSYLFHDSSEEDIHGVDTGNVNFVLIDSTKRINPLLAYIEKHFNKDSQSLLYVKYQSFNTEFCRAQSEEGYIDVYSCITELLPVTTSSLKKEIDNNTRFPYRSLSLDGDAFTIPEDYINYMNYDKIECEDKRTLSYSEYNMASFADALYRFYVVNLAKQSKNYSQSDLDLLIHEVKALSGQTLITYTSKRISIEEMTTI